MVGEFKMKSTQVVMINFIKKKNQKKIKKKKQKTSTKYKLKNYWMSFLKGKHTTQKRRHGVDYNIKQHTRYIVIVCCNIMLNICSNKLEKKNDTMGHWKEKNINIFSL